MSAENQTYGFRRLDPDHLVLVNEWQRRPHVAEWWDATTEYTVDDIADRRVAMWLVELHGKPFAFIQDYVVHGFVEHHFAYLPPGSKGIDQFIAEPGLLGFGYGPAFIKAHVARLFSEGVPVIGTDPHPRNARAIAAYRKAGFKVVSEGVKTAWGPSLLMECHQAEFARLSLPR